MEQIIRINDVCLKAYESENLLKRKVADLISVKISDITKIEIVKRSVDARRKNDIKIKYTVDIELSHDEEKILKINKNASAAVKYEYKRIKSNPLPNRPVIVGSGPAGLFAALILAQGGQNPIVLERGRDVDKRAEDVENFFKTGKLNTSSNIQFGEGGAGTFSDGKLTTGTKDPRMKLVLEEFVNAGAPSEIIYQAKPHIGTDYLKTTVKNLRKKIISLGGEFKFETKLTSITAKDGKVTSIKTENSDEIQTDNLILAIGHSARDTFEMLNELGIEMQQKAFSIGARIEHPREMINRSQYGKFAGAKSLSAADYKLAVHLPNGRGVYTFCVCPGGTVVAAASEENRICTNGMSVFARDAVNTNSALLVGVTPQDFGSDHPLAGMYFQREIESRAYNVSKSYKAPAQLVGDFLKKRPSKRYGTVIPSYEPGVHLGEIDSALPKFICDAMRDAIILLDKKMHGFAMDDAVLTAPETRSSSPVKIIRDKHDLQSISLKGLYPCGEGAGYAGGIMSAAVDGIKCAEQILMKYSN